MTNTPKKIGRKKHRSNTLAEQLRQQALEEFVIHSEEWRRELRDALKTKDKEALMWLLVKIQSTWIIHGQKSPLGNGLESTIMNSLKDANGGGYDEFDFFKDIISEQPEN